MKITDEKKEILGQIDNFLDAHWKKNKRDLIKVLDSVVPMACRIIKKQKIEVNFKDSSINNILNSDSEISFEQEKHLRELFSLNMPDDNDSQDGEEEYFSGIDLLMSLFSYSLFENGDTFIIGIDIQIKNTDNKRRIYLYRRDEKFYVLTKDGNNVSLADFENNYLSGHYDLNNITNREIIIDIASIGDNMSVGKKNEWKEGAISFFDFLGWKGVWHNDIEHLEKVGKLIDDIIVEIDKLSSDKHNIFTLDNSFSTSKLISISDTIAIFTPNTGNKSDVELLNLHAKFSQIIMEKSLAEGYPIRGAVGYGEYNTRENVMIGPGIDECASWHETCDWMGVHFTPSAQFILDNEENKERICSSIVKYDYIPLKNGYSKLKYCIDWCVDDDCFKNIVKNAKSISPNISAKYINTYNFIYKNKNHNKIR